MAYELRNNQGSLFPNDKKETEKQPDHKGDALIACPHCSKSFAVWMSAWIKHGRRDFLSLSFTPKDDKSARTAGESASNRAVEPGNGPVDSEPPPF